MALRRVFPLVLALPSLVVNVFSMRVTSPLLEEERILDGIDQVNRKKEAKLEKEEKARKKVEAAHLSLLQRKTSVTRLSDDEDDDDDEDDEQQAGPPDAAPLESAVAPDTAPAEVATPQPATATAPAVPAAPEVAPVMEPAVPAAPEVATVVPQAAPPAPVPVVVPQTTGPPPTAQQDSDDDDDDDDDDEQQQAPAKTLRPAPAAMLQTTTGAEAGTQATATLKKRAMAAAFRRAQLPALRDARASKHVMTDFMKKFSRNMRLAVLSDSKGDMDEQKRQEMMAKIRDANRREEMGLPPDPANNIVPGEISRTNKPAHHHRKRHRKVARAPQHAAVHLLNAAPAADVEVNGEHYSNGHKYPDAEPGGANLLSGHKKHHHHRRKGKPAQQPPNAVAFHLMNAGAAGPPSDEAPPQQPAELPNASFPGADETSIPTELNLSEEQYERLSVQCKDRPCVEKLQMLRQRTIKREAYLKKHNEAMEEEEREEAEKQQQLDEQEQLNEQAMSAQQRAPGVEQQPHTVAAASDVLSFFKAVMSGVRMMLVV